MMSDTQLATAGRFDNLARQQRRGGVVTTATPPASPLVPWRGKPPHSFAKSTLAPPRCLAASNSSCACAHTARLDMTRTPVRRKAATESRTQFTAPLLH